MTDIVADERMRRRLPGAGRGGGGRRLGPDPQPGDAGRQPLQRLAGGRHRAVAAGLRRQRWSRPGRPATRRIPIDEFFVRSGLTTLERGELVTAIELPAAGPADRRRPPPADPPARPRPGLGHAVLRDRRGGDHAPGLRQRRSAAGARRGRQRRAGRSGDATDAGQAGSLEALFADASPSPRSMRAEPRVPPGDAPRARAARAVGTALDRLAARGTTTVIATHPDRGSPSTAAPRELEVAAPAHPARGPARRPRPDRHQGMLPRRRVRRLHRAASTGGASTPAWCSRSRPTAPRSPPSRASPPTAGSIPSRQAFLDQGAVAVRLLHPGPGDVGARLCSMRNPHPTIDEVQEGLAGQPLPLRLVPADHRGGPGHGEAVEAR